MRQAIVAAAALLLAACQTAAPPQGYVLLHANRDAKTVARQISDNVGPCWFEENTAFTEYSYAPELASAERPRVLIVDKADPEGLPKLVIEVAAAKRGSDVKLFGPLMDTEEADRIRRDVSFWAGGGRTCR
jgi:hypothetical protein